ncbi:hypothetical protein HWD29_gp051 [Klebsiella phage KpS8]|uniref:Tail spike protein n=2 Tax=Mydovirus KpS8 TaxID=2723896 RepID=A0A7L8ZHX1_9CAUD|nr:hypothetical protein HWD29_gp051 [Klebsiella phage KpS8]QIW88223.1 hypothetical protein kps8_051 [Klebsiella phage KpS8]QOI68627.1 tail spike protein [Klebsiella phage vB_KpnM_Seu621]
MAFDTIKIAELPSATQVVGDDYLVVEQPDKTKKATAFQVISDLDLANKSSLTGPGGAAIIGTEDGEGVQKSLDTDRVNTRELWRRALHDLGLTLVDGSFEEGATLTYTTDAIWHMAGAQCYTWSGTFPKSVPAGSTPSNTGSEWLTVGGLSLLDEVTEIKNEAVEAKDEAVEAKNQAEAYVLQASEFGNLYPNTAAGLAATTSGQYFQVPQGSGSSVSFKAYLNNAGVAQEVASMPGSAAIAKTLRTFATVADAQAQIADGNIPNQQNVLVKSSEYGYMSDEYINNNGTLELTGRRVPSQEVLKQLSEYIASLGTQGFLPENLSPETGYVFGLRDPVTQRSALRVTTAGTVEIPILSAGQGVITLNNLADEVATLLPESMSAETGYVFGLRDPVTKKYAMLVSVDGTVTMPMLKIPEASVGLTSLDEEMSQLVPVSLSPDTGYVYGLRDPVTLRYALLVAVDGHVTIPLFALGEKVVLMKNLADEVTANIIPVAADVVDARPEPMRAAMAEISVRTIRKAGSGWAQFPSHICKAMIGVNTSGVSLQFRKSAGLQFTGKAFVGAYSPGALQSKVKKGRFTSTPVSTPTGTFNAGDYYTYEVYNSNNNISETTPGTWNGQDIYLGDHLVYDGAAWAIQPSPGRGAQRAPDMYFTITADGWFDAMEVKQGDKLMFLTNQTAGGARLTPTWVAIPSSSDRLFYAGEFTPASLPTDPIKNGVYQATSTGVIGADTYAVGDYGWYDGSGWIKVMNDDVVITVAAGGSVALRCTSNSDEWEVRRTDKNDVPVGVRMKAQVMTLIQEVLGSKQLLIGDSMFGSGSSGTQIISATGVTGEVRSYGGSTSEQVLGMFKKEILSWGDNYKAQTIVVWHGQNNQPSTDLNAAQLREVSMQMAQLAGARDIKTLFLTILGQRTMTWNGTRIVVQQQEDQFAKTGILYELSDWYSRIMPGRYANTYEILLSAATDAIDPTFPGMTEKQVAAKYGILPWSFFNGSTLTGLTTNQLVYKGTWTGTALPTGGSSGDYYLRTDTSSNVGNVIYNSGGTWIENSIDRTHLSNAGGTALCYGGDGFSLGTGYTNVPARDGVADILTKNHFYR